MLTVSTLPLEEQMEIQPDQWTRIVKHFGHASHITASPRRSVPYCALATINDDGSPRVTPISSLVLGNDRTGFYFEQFSAAMSKNLDRDPRVGVLVVTNKNSFWKRAVFRGRMSGPPAVRLWGTVGPKREATAQEIRAYRRPIRAFKFFRGYKRLWGVMRQGREIRFHAFEPVNCGPMPQDEFI
jgi:hypothetical protein